MKTRIVLFILIILVLEACSRSFSPYDAANRHFRTFKSVR
jgi:hypothetical protein